MAYHTTIDDLNLADARTYGEAGVTALTSGLTSAGIGLTGAAVSRRSPEAGSAISYASTGYGAGAEVASLVGAGSWLGPVGLGLGALAGVYLGARARKKAHEQINKAKHKTIQGLQGIEIEEAQRLGSRFFTPQGRSEWESAVAARAPIARIGRRFVGWQVGPKKKAVEVGRKGWIRQSSLDPLGYLEQDPRLLKRPAAQHGYSWAKMALTGQARVKKTKWGVKILQADPSSVPEGMVPTGPTVVAGGYVPSGSGGAYVPGTYIPSEYEVEGGLGPAIYAGDTSIPETGSVIEPSGISTDGATMMNVAKPGAGMLLLPLLLFFLGKKR
jgi:hypothetical protein